MNISKISMWSIPGDISMVVSQKVKMIVYNHHGQTIPLKLWLNHHWCAIDQILNINNHSAETGGFGRMYLVMIEGSLRRLYHMDDHWCLLSYQYPMVQPLPSPGIIA